jgi:hypothetical protein
VGPAKWIHLDVVGRIAPSKNGQSNPHNFQTQTPKLEHLIMDNSTTQLHHELTQQDTQTQTPKLEHLIMDNSTTQLHHELTQQQKLLTPERKRSN